MAATVLIVDDGRLGVHLGQVLEIGGYAPLLAQGARMGLRLAEKRQPNVILTDWLLPDMDGFKFIRQLRDVPVLVHTPFIVMSADVYHRDEVLAAGAAMFLRKPVLHGGFLSSVGRVLSENHD